MIWIVVWGICGALGYAVSGKEKKVLGTILGVLLGPLGVVAAAVACKD
jgi:hypothetical protein